MKKSFVILSVLAFLVSCTRDDNFSFKRGEASGPAESWATVTRTESDETRNVLILYSAGLNDLCQYLDDDIRELPKGYVPQKGNRADHVFLVYSRLTKRNENTGVCDKYSKEPTESVLFRLYSDSGKVVHDTLKVWGREVNACSPETVREVLQFAYDRFPAKGYGMVLSSHASGWLPSGYYFNPSKYDSEYSEGNTIWTSSIRRFTQEQYPPIDPYPAVKSVGQDNLETPVEMNLEAFADAIPFHLDYLLFDACLMGCVEVAYQLRGKADVVGFSQTEVLANGFDYHTLASRLLKDTPDPLAVCQDYFSFYEAQTGDYHSATISLVDTRKMEPLADVCKTLFEKYRDKINSLGGYSVQGYFRFGRHFFYDLKDILKKAGISPEEEAALDAALSQCVLYKAATDHFLSFTIKSACGFSMYLPSMGSGYLDNYYRTSLAWNKDTELVK